MYTKTGGAPVKALTRHETIFELRKGYGERVCFVGVSQPNRSKALNNL